MKKWVAVWLAVTMLCLTACRGNVALARVAEVDSTIYSQAEISAAVRVAMSYFKTHFDGCTLTAIGYAGDDTAAECASWARQYDADEAIILLSDFEVDANGGGGSLQPDSTYTNWQWVLVRDGNGSWRHATHGYG
ncbi:MAG: hypothetical protein IJZ13_00315 [Clostridia bacterium]|nr:hypothetical protein [Clostridia bacterium]